MHHKDFFCKQILNCFFFQFLHMGSNFNCYCPFIFIVAFTLYVYLKEFFIENFRITVSVGKLYVEGMTIMLEMTVFRWMNRWRMNAWINECMNECMNEWTGSMEWDWNNCGIQDRPYMLEYQWWIFLKCRIFYINYIT